MHRFHRFLSIAGAFVQLATAQAEPPVTTDIGVAAHVFDISQVTLNDGRFHENQHRTLNYLKFVDPERLLYVFRENHNLSTAGATANGGWDAPDFPFRSHVQGHVLSAWSQCYSTLKDVECRDRAVSFVADLLECQENNEVAGFNTGYLSGFPESDFDALEARTLSNGNVPYYAIHKTLQGLLDVWRNIGDSNAEIAALALAGWVDYRTSKLTTAEMQAMLETEFGGMNDILTDIYRQTGDETWITVAQRFDHAAVFNPLAADTDELNGLHANTQVPKWIGATREFKATGTTRYHDIAKNAWDFTVGHHTYAIGGNSQAEHFHPPDEIAGWLTQDTCEHCNSVNMLKLTKELWTLSPDPKYFDFYEQSLINHILGAQNLYDDHGGITYFTPLVAGGHRGVGPAWGGGTWSTDYDSFWCCQGTGLEVNTRLMDSVYAYDDNSLFINLFTPSTLDWRQKGIIVTQDTKFPLSDTTIITIDGDGTFDLKIRIPAWTSGATIVVSEELRTVDTTPGTYAIISGTWVSGTRIVVQLPMTLHLVPANDDASLVAIVYGPVILSGNYGDQTISSAPTLNLSSLSQSSTLSLDFTGTANGTSVDLSPFFDANTFNYVVYWKYFGSFLVE